jgi:hypothetical protein
MNCTVALCQEKATSSSGKQAAIDTMTHVSTAPQNREAIITDEGTNEPTGFEHTTFNGKDVYIKQESKLTIIYEPQ